MEIKTTDVLIAGGGIAGLSAALLLAQQGIQCIVIEAGEPANETVDNDPRTLAITHASRQIMSVLGLWERLPEDKIGVFKSMHAWDENGRGKVEFDSAELCIPALGYIIPQTTIEATLTELLPLFPKVSVCYQTKLRSIASSTNEIVAMLDNGSELHARVLIGADGLRSTSRQLAEIEWQTHDYKQHAVACLARVSLGHNNTARQRFLSDGPLAFLPMHDPQQCGVVWSTSPEYAERLMDMNEDAFNRSLQEAFDHTLGAILETQSRASFPLMRAEASSYSNDRVALIGDAAHSVHPLAGQGANLALLDAASLVQLIVKAHEQQRDIGSRLVLRRYERWRKGENKTMLLVLEGFKYIFENQRPPVPGLRNAALNFANAFEPLKHTIMKHAMGISGDLPELAKNMRY